MRWKIFILLSVSILLLMSGCMLFETEVTFYIGVASEAVRYVYGGESDYYTPTSVSFDGNTVYPGEYEEVTVTYGFSDTSKNLTIYYEIEDRDAGTTENGTFNDYIYPDDGNYIAVTGFTSEQYGSLSTMNSDLSSSGLSTFSDSSGSSDAVCGTSYEGPDSDPQRDSYCQAAYAYRCGYGYSLSSTQVQSQCDLYEAMGGSSCQYCR